MAAKILSIRPGKIALPGETAPAGLESSGMASPGDAPSAPAGPVPSGAPAARPMRSGPPPAGPVPPGPPPAGPVPSGPPPAGPVAWSGPRSQAGCRPRRFPGGRGPRPGHRRSPDRAGPPPATLVPVPPRRFPPGPFPVPAVPVTPPVPAARPAVPALAVPRPPRHPRAAPAPGGPVDQVRRAPGAAARTCSPRTRPGWCCTAPGGIGKSALAAEIAGRAGRLEPGRRTVAFTGEVSADTFLARLASALRRHPVAASRGGARALAAAGRTDLSWAHRLDLFRDHILRPGAGPARPGRLRRQPDRARGQTGHRGSGSRRAAGEPGRRARAGQAADHLPGPVRAARGGRAGPGAQARRPALRVRRCPAGGVAARAQPAGRTGNRPGVAADRRPSPDHGVPRRAAVRRPGRLHRGGRAPHRGDRRRDRPGGAAPGPGRHGPRPPGRRGAGRRGRRRPAAR